MSYKISPSNCRIKAKQVSDSRTVISLVMMPAHANHYGHVHGGTIMKLVDEAAFVVATRHARKNVVTASMEDVSFKHQVRIGDILTLHAELCYVGRTSMEVEVNIETEILKTGAVVHVGKAFLSMVALDDDGTPTAVPGLILRTKTEKRKSSEALRRRKARIEQ